MTEQKDQKEKKGEEVRYYRILAGGHEQPDYDAKPQKLRAVNPDTGEMEVIDKYPVRSYTAGQVVASKQNLVNLFGGNKFQEVVKRGRRYETVTEDAGEEDPDTYQKADPTPLNAQAPRGFPHGQTYQGHPATSGYDANTGVGSFQQSPEEAQEIAEKHADRLPAQGKEKAEKAQAKAQERERMKAKASKSARPKGRTSSASSQEETAEDETDFHSMKKDELLQYAADNEVNLGDASTKEEIVKKLEKSRR